MLKQIQPDRLDITIDYLRPDDLAEIAILYEKSFSNHFLGHMGRRFLKLFCAQFVNSSTNFGYVAKCNDKLVGFLLGTINRAPFHQFYRQNFLVLAMIVIKRYLTDSFVRKQMTKRFGYVLTALKTLLPFTKKESNVNQSNAFAPARLLAIGVDSNYRGTEIASKLTDQFCREMKSKGLKKVGLSVLCWNERAINFYKKDGWTVDESCETYLSFIRDV